jgi:hypothetical protein
VIIHIHFKTEAAFYTLFINLTTNCRPKIKAETMVYAVPSHPIQYIGKKKTDMEKVLAVQQERDAREGPAIQEKQRAGMKRKRGIKLQATKQKRSPSSVDVLDQTEPQNAPFHPNLGDA